MHILATLVAAIGVVGVLLWRVSQAAHAARETIDAASEASGLIRRFFWRRRANKNPLDAISDPREAAAAMMVAVAQWDGSLTANEEMVIKAEMQAELAVSKDEAEELFARGRWLAKDVPDLAAFFRRVSPAIRARCSRQEQHDLLAMLARVAKASGKIEPVVAHDIAAFAEHLRPR